MKLSEILEIYRNYSSIDKNFDVTFLKKGFKFFFDDKKQEQWYIILKTFIL